jgi:hypothetical protein
MSSRLAILEHGHEPEAKARLDEARARMGFVSDVRLMLMYRPELFGQPFSEALQAIVREESEWSVAERELFATFVSSLNQCPF